MSKRTVVAVVAAVAAFGAVSASAASLGGLTSKSLGADTTVVAACDTVGGVSVTGYTTTYSVATSQYVVSAVTLGNLDTACNGASATVTLGKTSGTAANLGSGTVTISGIPASSTTGTASVSLSPSTIPAKDVEQVAVVISG